jgi:hypothetical protein
MHNGHQEEDDFPCIHGGTAMYNWNAPPPMTIAVQGCRKKDLEGDWCGPWADYTFSPPKAPAAQEAPEAAPAPVPAAPAPKPDISCPEGSPTPTVPAGQKCAPKPDVTLTATPGEPLGGGTPAPQSPPAPAGHTVISDVELYDTPGGSGTVIGELKKGDAVTLNGPCPIQNAANPDDANNGWCKVTDTTLKLTGAVWGDSISK